MGSRDSAKRWRPVRELAALQRRFYATVTAGGDAAGIVASGDLDIYARMYASRLHDTLAVDYPTVRAMIGDDAFAALATRYVECHAPRSYTLRDAGLELPAFLARTASPWLAELAQLERARIEVFDGPDARPLAQDEVAAHDLALPDLELRVVPASVVVPLTWAIDDTWSAIADGGAGQVPVREARSLLVWRRGAAVFHRTLDRDEAELAPRLVTGIRFAEVCELLAKTHGDEAASRATELLLRWLRAEILVASVGP